MPDDDAGKRAKSSVRYSRSTGKDRCGVCEFFLPQQRKCRRVRGEIDPAYWCELFERKEG